MVKLFYLFLLALCLSQNFHRTLADSKGEEEDEIEIKFIRLKFELPYKFQDLTSKLINLDKSYIKEVFKTNISLTKIFKFAKEEIAGHADDSTVAEECSVTAYKELDNINEKTKTDVANCIAKGVKRTSEVIEELEHDTLKMRISVSEDLTLKTTRCLQKFKLNDPLFSSCLDVIDRMKMFKSMEEAAITASDKSVKILQQVAEDVGRCLKEVTVNTLVNTEHVTDEFKSCINEANIYIIKSK